MIGVIAYGVGTFLTLQSGMASFESTCHTVDSLIDRFVDINTISFVFMNGGYAKLSLRCKSERQVYYTFEEIVFRLCTEFPGADAYGPYTRDSLKQAVESGNEGRITVVDAMFTHTCKVGTGDTSWVMTAKDQELHAWVQERLSLEDRRVVADAMILMSNLSEEGRLV